MASMTERTDTPPEPRPPRRSIKGAALRAEKLGPMRPDGGRLLRPAEAARILGVDAQTVTRWAITGRIAVVKTAGGHRRFKESDVRRIAAETLRQ
jgi:excisionase family DNA binding protein